MWKGVTPADTATSLAVILAAGRHLRLRNSAGDQQRMRSMRILVGLALRPLVHRVEPKWSAKIIGMFLEMDQCAVGQYRLNPVCTQLETARFQPLHLKLCVISCVFKLCF